MRGLFTCGIMDVMLESGITFDGLIGVSAGAAFGCNYKSNQPGRALRYNLKYSRDPRYCSIRSLIKTGNLYGADFCYHELPDKLDLFDTEAFIKNPMEFHVVATDVETGEPVYRRLDRADYEDLEWMRGSASMPLVSRVVEVGGRRLLDGGLSDSVPLRYFEGLGYTKNVVILTRPRGYKKKKSGAIPLMRLCMRRCPGAVSAAKARHTVYNETIEYILRREEEGACLVICPDEALPISRTERDPEKLRAVYDIGRRKGEEMLKRIADFLE